MAVVAALSGCGGGDEPRPAQRLTLGVNASPLFNDARTTPSQLDARIRDAAGDGVRLVRTDAFWEVAEPEAPVNGVHSYDWAFNDRDITVLARHGIRWWAILDYAPSWASGVPRLHGRPLHPEDFAAYSEAFIARYGPRGTFWDAHRELPRLPVEDVEVWNEPDSPGFWKPEPDPVAYARLYDATREAVHAAAPGVRVWTGGLSHADDYIRRVLDAVTGPVDGIAVHAYTPDPAELVRRIAARVRFAGSPAQRVALTEFGLRTDKPSALDFGSERTRARFLPAALKAVAASGCVQSAFLFAWTTHRPNYGVTPIGGGSTPSRRAWATATQDPPKLPPAVPGCRVSPG